MVNYDWFSGAPLTYSAWHVSQPDIALVIHKVIPVIMNTIPSTNCFYPLSPFGWQGYNGQELFYYVDYVFKLSV